MRGSAARKAKAAKGRIQIKPGWTPGSINAYKKIHGRRPPTLLTAKKALENAKRDFKEAQGLRDRSHNEYVEYLSQSGKSAKVRGGWKEKARECWGETNYFNDRMVDLKQLEIALLRKS